MPSNLDWLHWQLWFLKNYNEVKPRVKIIGCGVSGMTVGIVLLEAGMEVEIITEKLPKDTTSAKAAAVWFPFRVQPVEKVNAWSLQTYHKFQNMVDIPQAGISMITLTTLVKKQDDTWWIDALPKGAVKKVSSEEFSIDSVEAYAMPVPLIETQLYLDYLFDQFCKLGGKVSIRKINSLEELRSKGDFVINCTGLQARDLTGDAQLFPIQGQIVKIVPQPDIRCITADFPFDDSEDKLAYIIPRRDCIVLGGTSVAGAECLDANDEVSKEIIARCKSIESNLQAPEIQSVVVGLRPGRSAIKLEREGNVVHNYGHGGAGFTVSWGCAMAVLDLVKEG
ncbi:MAG TPA: FAD-binding oxidoreductase [Phaeodactylibacter sp.]|nr:FAD-binding oxidoreductase [Phaeodactylibacter sp.]